jgi:hypothetical protein
MMENKPTFDNAVALGLDRPDTNSLTEVFDLSKGVQGISPNTQIPNKPRSTSWRDTDHHHRSIQRTLSKGGKNGI